ncbi:MAG: hypothetical protein HQL46_01845 [Gammaproteobacteria bacterium]|nr:hypothetical protein [Gammaproteobacteria bacterium]
MNNMSVQAIRETQLNTAAVKSDNKQTKEVAKKENNEVQVSRISQHLSSGSTGSSKIELSAEEGKELASQVAGGQKQLADAQSAHITMEFVESLLSKSPYE